MSMISNFRRPVKPTRIAEKPALPFGIGLDDYVVIAEFPVEHDATQAVAITEAEDCGFRFCVRHFKDEVEVATVGFDAIGDARAMAWHLSTPMPVEPEPAVTPVVAPVAAPARKSTWTRHTAADEAWWMLNSPLNATMFDLAPICGGSPEPECGVSGRWSLPGEDEGLTFSERVELLPEPVGCLSDDHNGAFGTFGCESE